MKKENLKKYITSFIFVAVVAALGGIFVNLGLDWYESLDKPNECLPSYVISLMWGVIYTTYFIYLIYLINRKGLNKKIIVYSIINGVLNVVWCLVFFTLNNLLIGEIALLVNLMFGIILIFEINKKEDIFGYLLMVYPCWLLIASSLNLAVWILN